MSKEEQLKAEIAALLKEQENIADLKKYNIALQSVKISEDIRKIFVTSKFNKK